MAVLAGSTVVVAADEGTIEGRVAVHPLAVALELSTSATTTGKAIQARATVTNQGSAVAAAVTVTLRLAPAGLVPRDALAQSIARIRAHRSAKVTWSLCPAAPGSYLLFAQATLNGSTVESRARVVTVTAGRRGC
jgi:hypothetical protein